jgi:hypothetical protein
MENESAHRWLPPKIPEIKAEIPVCRSIHHGDIYTERMVAFQQEIAEGTIKAIFVKDAGQAAQDGLV